MYSAEICLRPVLPRISPELISTQSLIDISTVATILPEGLGYGMFGFECRLSPGIVKADFLICASVGDGGRHSLGRLAEAKQNIMGIEASSVWGRFRHFVRQWNTPSTPLYLGIDNIWLEFDLAVSGCVRLVPSIFFEPKKINGEWEAQQCIAKSCIEMLQGASLSDYVAANFRACFAMLPDQAHIYQVGAMLSRTENPIRLCIKGLLPGQLPQYLNRLGANSIDQSLQEVLSDLSQYVDFIGIDLDVSENIGSTIGIECYCVTPDRLKFLLNYLVDNGLCTPNKQHALIQFPGVLSSLDANTNWPEALSHAELLFKGNVRSAFVCTVNHIKVTYEPKHSLHAKAYLGVRHTWFGNE